MVSSARTHTHRGNSRRHLTHKVYLKKHQFHNRYRKSSRRRTDSFQMSIIISNQPAETKSFQFFSPNLRVGLRMRATFVLRKCKIARFNLDTNSTVHSTTLAALSTLGRGVVSTPLICSQHFYDNHCSRGKCGASVCV